MFSVTIQCYYYVNIQFSVTVLRLLCPLHVAVIVIFLVIQSLLLGSAFNARIIGLEGLDILSLKIASHKEFISCYTVFLHYLNRLFSHCTLYIGNHVTIASLDL